MVLKLHAKCLVLGVLIAPLALWADSSLDYQNRGDRFEGIKPKPVSGYDIEVISVLVDYQEPTAQLPDQLRVAFHLPIQTTVQLTVREQDYRLYYWLDKIQPVTPWVANKFNEFTWPTSTVLRQLDRRLNLYELGTLIRLNRETPGSVEEVAPAILYHTRLPEKISGYLFTMKTYGDARLSCTMYQDGTVDPVMNQSFRRIPGGRPFTVRWDAAGAKEARHALVCKGFFLDTNVELKQTVQFLHKPTAR